MHNTCHGHSQVAAGLSKITNFSSNAHNLNPRFSSAKGGCCLTKNLGSAKWCKKSNNSSGVFLMTVTHSIFQGTHTHFASRCKLHHCKSHSPSFLSWSPLFCYEIGNFFAPHKNDGFISLASLCCILINSIFFCAALNCGKLE